MKTIGIVECEVRFRAPLFYGGEKLPEYVTHMIDSTGQRIKHYFHCRQDFVVWEYCGDGFSVTNIIGYERFFELMGVK